MTSPDLFAVSDATWPAAAYRPVGPWVLRDGQGGGKRVSATSATEAARPDDIALAEADMAARGQSLLFTLQPKDAEIDTALADRGYEVVDPTNLWIAPIDRLTDLPVPRVTAFCIWEPLAIMEEIWAKGGIGPARLAVMARAAEKTGILARWNERPAGAAFAAIHEDVCMVHAVEILPEQRRQGVASWVMRAAAFWAAARGARHISVLCTQANEGANRLYSSLGFETVGQYHYRHKRSRKVP
ncbi:GNAT family N-acetyltransferase [Roseobacter sinensis]|uniref:GNAT family N-acetyltransferase n=1 Tax=Roseobacter sinensis TaxID=2931391 RepID=A0ABT3BDH3_9RHOB|nr:GNAT family N-acetyltransferase [Roseobacter sp. WL0113]MCV3271631.1 GNAT family N-acetyltransferase [Roseobacter sp. WL0113]